MPERKYTVAVPVPPEAQHVAGSQFGLRGVSYSYEEEALDPIGAAIVEVPAATDAEFLAGARQATR